KGRVDNRPQYVPLQEPKLPLRRLESPRPSAHRSSQRQSEVLGKRTPIVNPKLEIRNKTERGSRKHERRNSERLFFAFSPFVVSCSSVLNFGFWFCFGFRISNFTLVA